MISLKKITAIAQLFLISFSALAQQGNYSDSIIYELKQINGEDKKDSLHYEDAIQFMYKNRKEVLLENKSVIRELDHLKNVLNEKDYYELFSAFYFSHFTLDSVPNDLLINFGRSFIEKNQNGCSGYCDTVFLMILRQTRIPFRNSSHLYEGIEYYIGLGNYFTEKNNRDAATIVYSVLAGFYARIGLIDKAEYYNLKSIDYLNDNPSNSQNSALLGLSGKANRFMNLGVTMLDDNKPGAAEKYLQRSINDYSELHSPLVYIDAPYLFLEMARCKTLLNGDSANYYFDKTFYLLGLYKSEPLEYAWYYMERAKYFLMKNEKDSASFYIEKTKILQDAQRLGITSVNGELIPNYYAATVALKRNEPKQAIQLLLPELQQLKTINANVSIMKELHLLANAYAASGMYKDAFTTGQELLQLNEKVKQESDNAKSMSFEIEKKMQENENNIARLRAQDENNKKTKYYLFGITALLGLFVLTLGIAIVNKQKSNARLNTKNAEIKSALEDLKQTQNQLIQSEKMASLGELTAGIAHEIQNPLNFVNNFAEINSELIKEMKQEIENGNRQEANIIADNIDENEQKILHHGQRAETIVKGMLQHSRSGAGVKEPTDINKFADEYLRLAYHGFRSKDKLFNVALQTDFDTSIGKTDINRQEVGRVLLNVYNNAFYTVNEKSKQQGGSYNPVVSVTTKRLHNSLELTVKDNGNGIPAPVVDKIFQPFFTTKPPGQGTGLGLSVSYDIIKAHGGEIKVQSKEGEGSEIVVQLPLA